jgi:hypothetical protein
MPIEGEILLVVFQQTLFCVWCVFRQQFYMDLQTSKVIFVSCGSLRSAAPVWLYFTFLVWFIHILIVFKLLLSFILDLPLLPSS